MKRTVKVMHRLNRTSSAAPVTVSIGNPTDPDDGDSSNPPSQQQAEASGTPELPNRQDNRLGVAPTNRMSKSGRPGGVAGTVAQILATKASAAEQLTVRETLLARLEQAQTEIKDSVAGEAGGVSEFGIESETGTGVTGDVSISSNLLAYAFRQTCRDCGMHQSDPKVCEQCPLVKSLTLALTAQPVLALQNQKAKAPA